jgi:hypothetical protein
MEELLKAFMRTIIEEDARRYPAEYANTPFGVHTHTCPSCGFAWTHDGQQTGTLTADEYQAVHTCQCGTVQTRVTKAKETVHA